MKILLSGLVGLLAGLLLGMMLATALTGPIDPGRALMVLYGLDADQVSAALASEPCDLTRAQSAITRIEAHGSEIASVFAAAAGDDFKTYARELSDTLAKARASGSCADLRARHWPAVEQRCRACHQAYRLGG